MSIFQRLSRLSTIGVAIVAMAFGAASCGGGGGAPVEQQGFDDSEVVDNYVKQSVVPTYDMLDQRAANLNEKVKTFVNNPNDSNLQAAREAWVKTRKPWEQSEAWLYGPVASRSYDPQLDTWAVDREQLKNVLNSNQELTQSYIAGLNNNKKGFHTIEFLLYGDGGSKTASDFGDRELDYLKATAAELNNVASNLKKSWTEGVEGAPAYRDVMLNAGSGETQGYDSVQAAGQEIANGMAIIVNEVRNGKIAKPFNERDTTLVESQFSYNSLKDFRSNIRGIRNAYTSKSIAGTSGSKSLSSWVESKDSELDSTIKTQIQDAIDAIDNIPEPFREAIQQGTEGDQQIQTALNELDELKSTINNELKPLLNGNR